jgi:hypothetical protein
MYTLLELQSKTFGELKKIGHELNVLPEGDRRRRDTWIDAMVGVNPPLLQLLETSPAPEVQAQKSPILETVEASPAAEDVQAQEPPIQSKFGRIVYPRPSQKAISQVAKTSPGVKVEPVQGAIKLGDWVKVTRKPKLASGVRRGEVFQVLRVNSHDGKLVIENPHENPKYILSARLGFLDPSEVCLVPRSNRLDTQTFIDVVRRNFPDRLQELLQNPPGVKVEPVQGEIVPVAENSPGVEVEPVQEAIVPVAENSPGVEVEPVQEALPNCCTCFDDGFLEDESGLIKTCLCSIEPKLSRQNVQRAIAPFSTKNLPGSRSKTSTAHQLLELFKSSAHIIEDSPGVKTEATVSESAIAPTTKTSPGVEVDRVQPITETVEDSPGVESDQNPTLTNADAWNPAEFGEVLHQAEPSGQLDLLKWDVNEPPEPDDYEGDMFAFHAAYDRWLLTSQLHEIIHTKDSPSITQAPESIAQNATGLKLPRNESADIRYVDFQPAQPDGNYSSTETAGLGNQESDRVLEVPGHPQGHRGQVIPHQSTQLSQSHDTHIKPQSSHEQRPPGRGDGRVSYLELEIGMRVGRRRDRHHLGKILAIYKSRRGIWRAKIQPLNKSNFVYYDCATLIEQRLLYDYEMNPGGFLPSGSTFDKFRGEKFEVYSRKVRSPKPTNWTAGELSSLSTFKLKQIAREMEIPSIPGTAGKHSLIRAILAEQAISQEKAAAQLERETGRAIFQNQKSGPTTGKKKRADASPLGTQLSLFNVAV